MNRVFNTKFEVSVRVVLLLDIAKELLSLDQLYVIDFVATYEKPFGLSKTSIQGENSYMFSEVTSRRQLVDSATRSLVLQGKVIPTASENGISYSLSDRGREYVSLLTSAYASKYRDSAGRAFNYIADVGLEATIAKISELASMPLGKATR